MAKKLNIAAVMALPALVLATGPAGAQPVPHDAGVSQQGDVVLNEIGAELDTSSGITGSFIELRNDADDDYDLADHVIGACDTNGILQTVVDFELGDVIPAGSTYLIADPNFSDPSAAGPPDKFFLAPLLLQAAGGVELVDLGTPVDDVRWGMMDGTDCAGFTDAGVPPDDEHSIQPNPNPPPAW